MLPLLLLIYHFLLQGCVADECEAGFADSCFDSVQSDLEYMLGLPYDVAKNISQPALIELCDALDDSLNCTSDIIDSECTTDDGREVFDSWVSSLRGAYDYVCDGKLQKLRGLFSGIRCWNVHTFFKCTKKNADLEHVRDLLHTELDSKECGKLLREIRKCHEIATVGSCREQENVKKYFTEMTDAFWDASHCDRFFTSSSKAIHENTLLLAASYVLALGKIIHHVQ